MTALDDRPALACGHYRRNQPECGSTERLVRLFIGWRCPEHTLTGAQVYEVAPLPGARLTGPGLVVADNGTLRAPGTGPAASGPDDAELPDPGRAAAAVHAGARGAEAQAAVLVMGRTGTPRRRLLEHIAELGEQGCTSWEAWTWYQQTHGPIDLYSLRPRLSELKRDGWIRAAGRTRHPRGNGDPAAPAEEVLVLTTRGQLQLAARAGTR